MSSPSSVPVCSTLNPPVLPAATCSNARSVTILVPCGETRTVCSPSVLLSLSLTCTQASTGSAVVFDNPTKPVMPASGFHHMPSTEYMLAIFGLEMRKRRSATTDGWRP